MIANIPWIETKYKEFNQKYWKNELAIPEFKTNNSKNNF